MNQLNINSSELFHIPKYNKQEIGNVLDRTVLNIYLNKYTDYIDNFDYQKFIKNTGVKRFIIWFNYTVFGKFTTRLIDLIEKLLTYDIDSIEFNIPCDTYVYYSPTIIKLSLFNNIFVNKKFKGINVFYRKNIEYYRLESSINSFKSEYPNVNLNFTIIVADIYYDVAKSIIYRINQVKLLFTQINVSNLLNKNYFNIYSNIFNNIDNLMSESEYDRVFSEVLVYFSTDCSLINLSQTDKKIQRFYIPFSIPIDLNYNMEKYDSINIEDLKETDNIFDFNITSDQENLILNIEHAEN